jgi:hypothetical protein
VELSSPHPFLTMYLKYVENTESPRLYHVWSALACLSAAMGRRCWYPSDLGPLWPNMYVCLVGQPAMRKGTAIKIATSLLKANTKVKFAPNDTGGQRQGLIRAMVETGTESEDQELLEAMQMVEPSDTMTLNSLATVDMGLRKIAGMEFDMRDPFSMFATASELNSLIGENNTQMLTFLQDAWDGFPMGYKYQLKGGSQEIENGLLSILAGQTPSQMSIAIPQAAIGGGFTSRFIFVFGGHQYKRTPRPALDHSLEPLLRNIYNEVFNRLEGAFSESAAAAELNDEIYMRGVTLNDTRFLHYCDRRGDHVRKVSMALAASRGSSTIDYVDVKAADELLIMTEASMPEAFGEYGMAKLGLAKQRLLESVRGATGPVPTQALYGLMSRDMSQMEFKSALTDLVSSRKLSLIDIDKLGQCIIAPDESGARKARKEVDELQSLLQRKAG